MYTSDISNKRDHLVWLGITIFAIVFSAVYEYFSFGVYSGYMIFLFAFPLILGFLPSLVLFMKGFGRLPVIWNDGVIALALWSLLNGVLEIYGTDSLYTKWLFIAGVVLLSLGSMKMLIKK